MDHREHQDDAVYVFHDYRHGLQIGNGTGLLVRCLKGFEVNDSTLLLILDYLYSRVCGWAEYFVSMQRSKSRLYCEEDPVLDKWSGQCVPERNCTYSSPNFAVNSHIFHSLSFCSSITMGFLLSMVLGRKEIAAYVDRSWVFKCYLSLATMYTCSANFNDREEAYS